MKEKILLKLLYLTNYFSKKGDKNLKTHLKIPTEDLKNDPYASVICYPRSNSTELKDRISELKIHGITSLDFIGKNNAFNIPILGKGFVGIVVKANIQRKAFAVKIRRIDASRKELLHEAKMLLKANSIQVGPKFQSVSKNCLVMELIKGSLLPIWLESCSDKSVIKSVFKDLLYQCRRLDNLGLDHGELSKATKHIIMNNKLKPFIVDFETASTTRKVSNVTSICQFLFLNYGEVGKTAVRIIGNKDRTKIINTLQKYKSEKTDENFNRILQACLS